MSDFYDSTFEDIKKSEVLEKIERAKKNAIPRDQLDRIEEDEDMLVAQFLAGRLSAKQGELKSKEIKSRNEHMIIFQTESSFRLALQLLGMDVFDFEETLSHELAHLNMARQKKLRSRLCLKFFKDGDRLGVLPGTRIEIDTDRSDNYLRDSLRATTTAPANLSPGDKRTIDLASKMLAKK